MTVPSGKLICPPTGFVILHFEVQWVYTVYRSLSRIMFPVPTIACSGSIHRFHQYSCCLCYKDWLISLVYGDSCRTKVLFSSIPAPVPDLWGQGLHIMCDWIFSMLYSIQLPSPESTLHTLCSLKSGSSAGQGIRAPLGTLSSYTRGKTKKTGKHDPVCFGLCTVTNVDWHDQLYTVWPWPWEFIKWFAVQNYILIFDQHCTCIHAIPHTVRQNLTEFWPFWTLFPIRFSNLTEFSYHLISYFLKN